MRDLEHFMVDHERILDGWEEGGVTGLVIGPLMFHAAKLHSNGKYVEGENSPVTILDPNPEVYRRFGVEAPAPPENKEPESRALLEKALQATKDRGFTIFFFQAQIGAGPGGEGSALFDEKSQRAISARIVDCLERFPMVDGSIMDGPEWGYEIAPHHMNHRSFFFNDLPESMRSGCELLGYDYRALVAAKDRLLALFHSLDVRKVRLHAGGGFVGGFHLLGGDPDLVAWLRFRSESLTGFFGAVKECMAGGALRSVQLGVGPRTAAFSPLCGYDFQALAEAVDILLPKHYFWHKGFDGLLGTVYRYVETLCEWNSTLSDQDALEVVRALFGLKLPGVENRRDLDCAHTPEFFREIVGGETRRALAVVDNPERVIPWVDAGRCPHGGDPMSAVVLNSLLNAAKEEGLRKFLYHHHGNLSPSEWSVMSELCGTPWNSRTSAYCPPDEMLL